MMVLGRDRISNYFGYKYLSESESIMTTAIVADNGATPPVAKTFAVARSAAGDASAVLYVREGANTTEFPKLEFSTKNANKNGRPGRRAATTIVIPYGTTDDNGVFTKTDEISISIVSNTPNDAPDSKRDDAAAFISGIMDDAQMKALIKTGFAV